VRIPPLKLERSGRARRTMTPTRRRGGFSSRLHSSKMPTCWVLNKPMGLAVQGGSGTTRHVDMMLEVLREQKRDGQRPRLVHRLDRIRPAACSLPDPVCGGSACKIIPLALGPQDLLGAGRRRAEAPTGRISTFLAKEEREDESIMRVARHGDDGAAMRYILRGGRDVGAYALLGFAQASDRAHASIARAYGACRSSDRGRPKYFSIENWQLPGGMQNKLHSWRDALPSRIRVAARST